MSPSATPVSGAKKLPNAFWHMRQWQICGSMGTALLAALEKIAAARGADVLAVDASDTAVPFFERRGYVGAQRNSVPCDDQWLSNTTMIKRLDLKENPAPSGQRP
jgi:putative acetyltransferase